MKEYSVAEFVYGAFASILAVGFVTIMSVSVFKYYSNKNDRLAEPTNDQVVNLLNNAVVSRSDDTVFITVDIQGFKYTSIHLTGGRE